MKTHILLARVLACAALVLVTPGYSSEKIPVTGSGFVAKDDSLRTFFDAMALQLKEPVIVSKMAARKKITGNFEFHDPNALLEKLSLQLGLIWYFDGQAIYIYDASEMRNAVVSLRNVSLNEFNNFLKRSGLYNKNYPLRGDNRKGTFYVSGPPVYVDMVVNGKRTARAVLTGMCYSAGSAMRHGSSSLTRLTGQSAMTPSTWRR